MFKNLLSITRRYLFVATAGLLLAPLHVAHAFAPPPKKLIEAGWERTTPSDMLANQKIMEKTPFDGVVLYVNGKDDQGKQVELKSRIFNPTPLKLSWFKGDIKRLQSFHSTKLTDNFPIITVRGNPPDWFDDKGWETIANNWKIAAIVAKESNLKGLCFDPEMYSGATIFTYNAQPDAKKHTFAQYEAKVRQRGKEIIEAIAKVDPQMVFFTFHMNELNRRYANGGLLASRYSLYPAFINGWLDAAPPTMTFVDGGESAYTFTQSEQYLNMANWIRNTGLSFIAPENRAKYRAQVQVSFGLYMDAYSYYTPSSKRTQYYLPPLNGSRLNRLQSNTDAAVNAADEYVWTWGEHYRWWPTDNKGVDPKTWEDVLPGTTNVLLNAVHPQPRSLQRRSSNLRHLTAAQAPQIDGKLNDAVYLKYAWMEPFVPFLSGSEKTITKTTAFAAWDANNLYITVHCEQPNIKEQKIGGDSHDSAIWNGESLEIAILKPGQPTDKSDASFYHFILNPANVHWDAVHTLGHDDMTYDPSWISAVSKTKDSWTAEIKLPFKDIGITDPHSGLKIHVNLSHKRDDSTTELSSWSQFIGGFQEPQNFGTWVLQ